MKFILQTDGVRMKELEELAGVLNRTLSEETAYEVDIRLVPRTGTMTIEGYESIERNHADEILLKLKDALSETNSPAVFTYFRHDGDNVVNGVLSKDALTC